MPAMVLARLSSVLLPVTGAAMSGSFTVYNEPNWCGSEMQTHTVEEGQCVNLYGGSIKLDTSDPHNFPWHQWAHSDCTGVPDSNFAAGVCGFVDSPKGQYQHGVRFGTPAAVQAVPLTAAATSGTFTVYNESMWCGTKMQSHHIKEGQCFNLFGGSIKLDTSDPGSYPWSQWAHSDCAGVADHKFAAGVCGFVDSPIGKYQHGVRFETPAAVQAVPLTAAATSGTFTVYNESNWCGTEMQSHNIKEGQCFNLYGGSIKLDTSDPRSFPWSQWARSDCTGAADHKFAAGVCGFVDSPIGQFHHGVRFGTPAAAPAGQAGFVISV